MVHVFTTAARNYLGKVRTLAHSIKTYHPEFKFHFVVADRAPTSIRLEEEPFDCMIAATAIQHDAMLATANVTDFRRFSQAGLQWVG